MKNYWNEVHYVDGTLVDQIEKTANIYPDNVAYEFMGRKRSYKKFVKDINTCARALSAIGVKEDDIVCIAMPNTPQAITFLYAVNKIGAIANMIHPLSSENEMLSFLNRVEAKTIILMNQFYNSIKNIRSQTKLENIIIADVKDALPRIKKLPYKFTVGRKIAPIDENEKIIKWNDLIKKASNVTTLPEISDRTDKTALILHSGGTTGKIKGVCLSNRNVNCSTIQMKAANPMLCPTDRMLTVMPIFHGNGLVIGVHTMLLTGSRCVLIPRFTPETYAKDLLKYKCNYMSGVPTLFEKLINLDIMKDADLSFLKGIFSGADYLSDEVASRINKFLKDHNCSAPVRQGYGMTEGVVASTLNPPDYQKSGSIGVALPDVKVKIVEPNTDRELPTGETGEIVFSSVTNMQYYYKDEEETAKTLVKHSDGNYWIHSGDLGSVDEDGFYYFKGRIKRMIVTNGYNVFPMELENIIEGHELVDRCCVVGLPDKERQEKVAAFVLLKPGVKKCDETKAAIKDSFRKSIAKYAMPRELIFIDELPKTKVGKVDYNKVRNDYLTSISNK